MSASRTAPKPPTGRESLRRIGLGVIGALSAALIIAAAYQIIDAVFQRPPPGPGIACRQGIADLLVGVQRARERASATIAGERTALAIFRREISPEWDHAAEIRVKCEQDSDKQALRAYRTVELLRYAEERAVRYEALDLAAFRKRAPKMTAALLNQPAPSP